MTGVAATLTDPIAEYDHSEGQSVTGGFVYRGSLYPALTALFLCGLCAGKIWSIRKTGSNPTRGPRLCWNWTPASISARSEKDKMVNSMWPITGRTIRRLADVSGPSPIFRLGETRRPPRLTRRGSHLFDSAEQYGRAVNAAVWLTM